jgi:hypothetical protein
MPARAEALQFLHHRRCLLRPAVHFIPGPRRQTEIGCPCPDETMQRVSEELQEALETTRRCKVLAACIRWISGVTDLGHRNRLPERHRANQ